MTREELKNILYEELYIGKLSEAHERLFVRLSPLIDKQFLLDSKLITLDQDFIDLKEEIEKLGLIIKQISEKDIMHDA